MDRAMLKSNARRQLGGGIFANNWLTGLVVCLIFTALPSTILGIVSGIGGGFSVFLNLEGLTGFLGSSEALDEQAALSLFNNVFSVMAPAYFTVFGVSSVVGILLVAPFTYGLNKTFLDLVLGGEKLNIETLFSGFRRYGDTVLLGFMQSLFLVLWSLLFLIPGIIKTYAYSLAYFVMIDHPEYGWRECLKESERLMKGYKFSYFVLQLSFIGWTLLGALVCGVGALFVAPYEYCTFANFYAWRVANDGSGVAEELA